MRILAGFIFLPGLALGFSLSPLKTTVDYSHHNKLVTDSSSTIRLRSSSTDSDSYEASASYTSYSDQQQGKVRPLHQNWWPCIVEGNLDATKPNAIEILGTKLVLWQSQGEWNCLEDKCSHRFAPLSEGRVVIEDEATKRACLQCSYHGWEFDVQGRCQHVPQTGPGHSPAGAKPVEAYPVCVAAGIVWVYMDPLTPDIAGSLELPISPMLQRWHDAYGDGACYMRDLPYGYELLGENLMDLSHLPHSHHEVGSLNRDLGGPIPFQMLGANEKIALAIENNEVSTPLYQAQIVDAPWNDPLFKSQPVAVPDDSSAYVSFYEAAHIRYTRRTYLGQSSEIELFMCPISPGKSRVFLYNVFEEALLAKEAKLQAKKGLDKDSEAYKEYYIDKSKNGLQQFKTAPRKTVESTLFRHMSRPDGFRSHLFSNKQFDGDGLFLQLQGDRMQRAGLTYKDYATPASADILVNSFRRYLEAASAKTLTSESSQSQSRMVEAANPPAESNAYSSDLPRSVALDRYESHTSQCKICSSELKKRQTRKKRLSFLQTAMTGAAGASTLSLLLLFVVGSEMTVPLGLLRCAVAATVSTDLAVVGLHRKQKVVQAGIDEFLFEDYVHADK